MFIAKSYPQKLLITHFQYRDWSCGNTGTGVALRKSARFLPKNTGTGVALDEKIQGLVLRSVQNVKN
ncbi:hypothetical protein BHECKSOX_2451 [Bathymodiolus heckerae thiotrophic gill symbiont]|nr:hypothetical protein BHECKSOX_2451 [Bathymodiolus heckerae thiotrophic gill symbiont]